MRKSLLFLAGAIVAGLFATGCANVEQKFGRGMANSFDIVRGGEFRRTMEQSALFDGPEYASTTGLMRGIHRTLARTGIGIYHRHRGKVAMTNVLGEPQIDQASQHVMVVHSSRSLECLRAPRGEAHALCQIC